MPASAARYDRVAQLLHWLIGIALIAQIAFGFLLDDIAPRGTPARGPVINLHKSIGIVLGLAILLRFAWRLWHHPPGWPASMTRLERQGARFGHGVLYACMLVMPASGYIASNFSKRGVVFFGHTLPPWGPDLPAVYNALNRVHVVTGWLFAALIVGHVLMALKHTWLDRDGTLARMTPWPLSR